MKKPHSGWTWNSVSESLLPIPPNYRMPTTAWQSIPMSGREVDCFFVVVIACVSIWCVGLVAKIQYFFLYGIWCQNQKRIKEGKTNLESFYNNSFYSFYYFYFDMESEYNASPFTGRLIFMVVLVKIFYRWFQSEFRSWCWLTLQIMPDSFSQRFKLLLSNTKSTQANGI